MKQKSIVTFTIGMIFVGVLIGLSMGYTPVGLPGLNGGIPSSDDDSRAQVSDSVSAFVTKSDNSEGKSVSISLVDDAGTSDRP